MQVYKVVDVNVGSRRWFRHGGRCVGRLRHGPESHCIIKRTPAARQAQWADDPLSRSSISLANVLAAMTIPRYSIPIVDEQNPCYCPGLPAASFLESLRQKALSEAAFRQLQPEPQRSLLDVPLLADGYENPCASFEKLLDQSISEDDLLELVYRRPTLPQPSPEEDSSLDSIYSVPARHAHSSRLSPRKEPSVACSDSFSDLQGPVKRERSFLAVNEGSFELSAKADRIQYFPTNYKSGFTSVDNNRRHRTYSPHEDWDTHLQDLNRRIRHLEGTSSRQDWILASACCTSNSYSFVQTIYTGLLLEQSRLEE